MWILFISIVHLKSQLLAQDQQTESKALIQLTWHHGSFITDVPKSAYLKDSYSYSGELSISRPVNGTAGKPIYAGIGLVAGHSGSHVFIGKMAAIYPFADFPLYHFGNILTGQFHAGLGMGWIEKPYDLESNHKNTLLGSHANLFVSLEWKNAIRLTSRFSLLAGLSFHHLSNASLKLPNLGLNIPLFSAGLRYSLIKNIEEKAEHGPIRKNWFYRIGLSGGVKQTPWIGSPYYGVALLSAEAAYQKRPAIRWAAGISTIYDPSLAHQYLDSIVTIGKQDGSKWNAALYGSFEKVIGKFSIPVQFGVYAFPNDLGSFYQ
ncbi:MAG TPA: acyloxyacyl hydrolase, partial [Flavisolibacter sp.]|nr:acyloxyacyl hydrolase [Flavisolibacter sp.]